MFILGSNNYSFLFIGVIVIEWILLVLGIGGK